MMYMADDYPPDLPWRDNINQMEAANQTEGTNVIALIDPLGPSNSQLLKVEYGKSVTIADLGAVIPAGGEVDMASPNTLSSFIRYSSANYQADRYVLILWGHGAGWIGMCPDGADILKLGELRDALSDATGFMGRPLDLIGVDSCAEANFELIYEIREYSRFFVGSEKNMPSQGLPYTRILEGLASNVEQSPEHFGSEMVRDYIDWSRYNSSYSATMAVFNLSRVDEVMDRLNFLSIQGSKYDSIFHANLNTAFADAEHYETPWDADFGDLMSQLLRSPLPLEIQMYAKEAGVAYLGMISAFGAYDNPGPVDNIRASHASGAVIYAASGDFSDLPYEELQIASTEWYGFARLARHTGPTNASGPGPSLTYGLNLDGLADSVTLKWPEAYETSQVWVFREDASGLVFIQSSFGGGPQLTVSGVAGYLTLSASVLNGTVAQSHSTVKVVLHGKTQLNVTASIDGERLRDFDVQIILGNTTVNASTTNGLVTVRLAVPTQVQIGDLVLVQVVDKKSREVLGSKMVIASSGNMVASIDTFHGKSSPQLVPLLLIAILPGLLILAFDLLLYMEDRKKKPR